MAIPLLQMGFATTDEMCLAFLYYYPAIDVNVCVSHPQIPKENLTAMMENQ